MDKLRTILNTLFIIGAIASVIIYFMQGYSSLFLTVILVSIALKIVEFFVRYMF